MLDRIFYDTTSMKYPIAYWQFSSNESEKAKKVNSSIQEGKPFGACYVATCVMALTIVLRKGVENTPYNDKEW